MKRENWTVTEHSERPAGNKGICFYCGAKLGEQHNQECVIRQRTVVMEFTIRMVVDVPESWTTERIEGRFNNGFWCADNLIDMLERKPGCLCLHANAKYIQEATKEDEDSWGAVKVDELES